MKINIKLLNIFVILFFLFPGISCGKIDDTENSKVKPSDNDIQVLSIPEREHGYSLFETTVITGQAELNDFISGISAQDNWNDKEAFLNTLNKEYDFSKYAIVLYRLTLGSGSIQVSVTEPEIINDSVVNIVINLQIPEIGTTDMAYYCFGYLINKQFEKVVFYPEGNEKVEVNIE